MPATAPSTEQKNIALYQRALNQKRNDKNKLYSLHEPHIYCISKDKEPKPYVFVVKISTTKTKNSNIIVSALAFDNNEHDSKRLVRILEQVKNLSALTPGYCVM